jgi:hypothetical protein
MVSGGPKSEAKVVSTAIEKRASAELLDVVNS